MTSAERDRDEIYDLMCRYCRAVDRADFATLRAVYLDGAVDHHTGFTGGADEFVDFVERSVGAFDGTQHIIGNHLAEIRGDVAVSETYAIAVHWGTPADDPRVNFTSGVRYVDHLERQEGRWGIRERWAVREWQQSTAGRSIPKIGEGPSGTRDADDPLIRLRSRMLPAGAPDEV